MYSLSGLNPQCVVPLAQLGLAVSSVRSQVLSRPYRSPAQKNTAKTQNALLSASQIENTVCASLHDLGLEGLCKNVQIKVLPSAAGSSQSALGESYVSADTFFENKNGFSEKELWASTFASLPLKFTVMVPSLNRTWSPSWSPKMVMQQTRGFKTRRARTATGMGKIRETDEGFSAIKFLQESVLGKMTSSSRRMNKVIQDQELAPEMQEKMKVAFAEGYMANAGTSSLWQKIFKWTFIILLGYCFTRILQAYSAIGGMKLNVLKGEHQEVNPEEIQVSFADVKGVDEAKQELQDIVLYLRDPDRFKSLGAKLPKGVLLVGPPGTGKTLLARAVAGEAGVPFFYASGSEFDEMFVGTGAKRVRQLFDAAKMRAPCVMFIDEIDTVGAKRTTSTQIHPYANQTINQLLAEMDGFQQNEGVIVLGATNKRENLDKALLRPGRFDVEVRVFAPDLKGRRDILELYLSKVKVSQAVNAENLAKGTPGCTGADLENIVNQAALKAAMDGASEINITHLEFAKDKILMGPAKKSRIPDEDTNLMTAYHEAGHTLVAYYTKDAEPVHKVTIIPRGMSLGHTSFIPEKDQYNHSKSQLLAHMDVAMGGRVAEELVYGQEKVTTGAGSDFQTATAIATAMVKQYGMSEKVGVRVFEDDTSEGSLFSSRKGNEPSQATTELVDSEIKRLLQESYERAKAILRAHSSEHKALAKALMQHETLESSEIKSIIEGKPLNKKTS